MGAASVEAVLDFADGCPCEAGCATTAPKKANIKTSRASFVGFMTISDFRFLSDRHTASHTEGFWRNFQPGSCLLAFVLAALDHADHIAHQLKFIAPVSSDLLGGVVLLHIVFQDAVQNIVGRQ